MVLSYSGGTILYKKYDLFQFVVLSTSGGTLLYVQENMICFNFGSLNLQRDIWCELARKQLCQTSPQIPPWDQKKERLVTNIENKRPPGEERVCVEEVVTTNASRELLHRTHRSHGVKP